MVWAFFEEFEDCVPILLAFRKKAKRINMHPTLEGVRRVKLSETKSSFWRFHTKGVADEGERYDFFGVGGGPLKTFPP